MREEYSVIGKDIMRVDGPEKAMGKAEFSIDFELPGMLHAKVLRSPLPHAKILCIDTAKAKSLPGVKCVLTAQDIPDVKYGYGVNDEGVMAREKVRFVGEAVAAVAADAETTAEEALDLIQVEYEELTPVLDVEEAMKPEPPAIVHEDLKNYWRLPVPWPQEDGMYRPNVANYFKIRRGDVEYAFKQSHAIVENRYSTSMIQHCQMESHNCVAKFHDGELTVWTSSQSLFLVKQLLCQILGLPPTKIRVIIPYVGGAYGGKIEVKTEPIASFLAMRTGRPVKLVYSRKEVFTSATVRHPFVIYLKDGVKEDGTLIAREINLILDTGAYSESGIIAVRNGALASIATYKVPNFKLDSYCVYTNKPIAGAFRGFGCTQVAWAIESNMDVLAHKLGMDPVEIRMKNILGEGDENCIGEKMQSVGIKECLKKAAEAIEWGKPFEKERGVWRRGKGIALGNKNSIAPTYSSAYVRVHEDETIEVICGALEVGQGGFTALSQMAAEEFGTAVDKIKLNTGDTKISPFEHGAFSSRQTYNAGNAIRLACQDAKGQLFEKAASRLEARAEDMEIKDRKIFVKGNPDKFVRISDFFMPVFGGMIMADGVEILGKALWIQDADFLHPETGQLMRLNPIGRTVGFYIHACQGADIEVNIRTGQIRVLNFVSANDIGKAINPQLIHGQAQGGVGMGIGSTLMEEMILENGKVVNPTFMDYKIPTSMEIPPSENLKSIIVEAPHPDGPYGAKGVGEIVLIPTASAIANALFNAIGVRINDLPLTPEKVLRAIKGESIEEKFIRVSMEERPKERLIAIDFSLTEEQKAIQKTARDFALKEIKPAAPELDKRPDPKEAIARQIYEKGLKLGFNTITVPQKYGGSERGILDLALVTEELAFGDAGVAESFAVSAATVECINRFGNEEQRERWLPRASKELFAFGATESSGGSDLFLPSPDPSIGPKTNIKDRGDHYVLNGTKCFITNGSNAGIYGVLARKDLNKPLMESACVVFIEKGIPGFSIGKIEDKMGQRLMSNAELIFEDVKVPKRNLVGQEGMGIYVAMCVLCITGPCTGALGVGLARAAMESARDYAKTRMTAGKPIIEHQAIALMLADMIIEIEAARSLVWKACWHFDNHPQPDPRLAAASKIFAADVCNRIVTNAVQILGGYGYMRDYPVEKYMRDAKVLQIYDGTNQILRLQMFLEL